MDNRDTKSKQWAQVLEQVEKIRFAMLTTENEGGHLHSRPMTTLDASEEGSLWFFIGRSNHVSREMENHPRVSLSYVAADQGTYLSIAGEAHLVEDPFKVKELWEPSMKPWFPQGIADPDLALLQVDVTEAEYWDEESKKMKTMVRKVKAMAGHPESEPDPGHGTLRPGRDV